MSLSFRRDTRWSSASRSPTKRRRPAGHLSWHGSSVVSPSNVLNHPEIRSPRIMKISLIPVLLAAGSLAILGCDKKPPANTAKPTGGGTHTHTDGTKHDDDHADHDHADHDDHDAVVSLGKLT